MKVNTTEYGMILHVYNEDWFFLIICLFSTWLFIFITQLKKNNPTTFTMFSCICILLHSFEKCKGFKHISFILRVGSHTD